MMIKKKKYRHLIQEENIVSELNLTPLIDIMMVLLIIFMVTSSISIQTGLDVALPSSSGGDAPETIYVEVTKDGKLFIDGDIIDTENISPIFESKLKKRKAYVVYLSGDDNSTLGRAMEIMDKAKAVGIQQFVITSKSEGSSKNKN